MNKSYTNYHMLDALIRRIVGVGASVAFDMKLLTISVFMLFLGSLFSTFSNLFVQNNFEVNFLGSLSTLAYISLFFYAKIKPKSNYLVLLYTFVFMTLGSVFLAWRYFDGYDGSCLYILIVLNVLYSLLSKGKHSIIIICLSIITMLSLGIYESYFPNSVLNYSEQSAKFADITFTAFIAIISIFSVVKVVFNRYLIREGVHEQNIILEGKNKIISEQNSKLKELNDEKDKFFSIIAHDLSSPLSGLAAVSEIMAKEFDSLSKVELNEMAQALNEASNSTFNLLNELLDWSRLQIGRMPFNPEEFNVADSIYDAVNLYKNQAEIKSINVVTGVASAIRICGDRSMLSTIFRNLISNAVKFTKLGGYVNIFADKRDNEFFFEISDDGVGILEEKLSTIFSISGTNSTLGTNDEKGAGLGLILCREFVEKHGGKIWVNSAAGKGSTFGFSFPIKKA